MTRPMAKKSAGSRGGEIARMYREQRGLDGIRDCPLDALLSQDEIEVFDSQLGDPGYLAVLLRGETRGGGILLAPGQTPGQRRFSLAHELGHFHIPSHQRFVGYCAEKDMAGGTGPPLELEANEFAAELLMPRALLRGDLDGDPLDFRRVYGLCDDYNVSVTACARRAVDVARHPCLAVASKRGKVAWLHLSPRFDRRLCRWVNDKVDAESLTAAAFRGETCGDLAVEVPPFAWLDERHRGAVVYESVHMIPRYQQTVAIITVLD
jgi:Zn-dependent peptidase ImmA (M78 family)